MSAGMKFAKASFLLGAVLMGLIMLAVPGLVAGQSCALCYTQAASSGSRMIEALRSGILVLIVPPTILSVAMIFILYHKRHQVRSGDDSPQYDSW